MKYCPLSSPELVRDLESLMDHWINQGRDFSMFIGYGWCVPRAAGTTVFPSEFPARDSDRWIVTKPILVDVVMKNQNSADDMSDNGAIPVNNDLNNLDDLNNDVPGIYATHARNGKLINTNLVFCDTYVETRKPGEIRNRYNAKLKNFF